MIFGKPDEFAIEAMLETASNSQSGLWGRMCIRAGNVVLGNYEEPYCSLYPAYKHFKFIIE